MYKPKVLRVNLSNGRISEELTPSEDTLKFIGGRGIAARHLYEELPPHADPLGPANKLIFVCGVLAGTQVLGSSRWLAVTKSPQTGCYARASGGADFGAWLKWAGFDHLIIEGAADQPSYLSITPDGCTLEDAADIWGKDTEETQEWLTQKHGKDSRAACIGPAGEKMVKFAAIASGRRTASRCGVGAVMGSKKLKAVVIRAARNVNLHDAEALRQLAREQADIILASNGYKAHKDMGTTDGSMSRNLLGVYPTLNFRSGQLENYTRISGNEYRKLRVGDFGCYGCPARCGKIHHIKDGPYAGMGSEGPEYESFWAFSGPINNTDIESTIAADGLCDTLGLDSISTGSTIGFAFELYEKGLITKRDADGLELTYGNHTAMIALIKKIAKREGFGNLLAEGSLRAARQIGKNAEYYAMQVKGLEMAAYEPRGLKATGFGYATSTIGASHGNGSLSFQEWGNPGTPGVLDRFAEEGKAAVVIGNQNNSPLVEAGIICVFFNGFGNWFRPLYPKMLAAATGMQEFADFEYIRKIGERIWNLEKAFNARDGIDRRFDTLPQRLQREPLHVQDAQGEGQTVQDLNKFLDEYYRLRGWTEQGIPSREKLEELGLGHIARDIESVSKI
jgi:aldehyde:ferredoxin oxidoreductase